MENLVIREASERDIDFIIETIIEADKSGSNVISACNILNVNELEYKDILKNILKDNIEGQEYGLSGFLIAEYNNMPIGALGSWVEGAGGISSYILYSNILLFYLDKGKIPSILENFKITKELSFRRETGAIQMEYGFVREEYRRRGVYTRLILESIKKYYPENKNILKAQGICFKDNYKSLNASLKIGFKIIDSKLSENNNLKKFFPYKEKVLLELKQQEFDAVLKGDIDF